MAGGAFQGLLSSPRESERCPSTRNAEQGRYNKAIRFQAIPIEANVGSTNKLLPRQMGAFFTEVVLGDFWFEQYS